MLGIRREYSVVALVVLMALCVMALRVGWVLDGPNLEKTAKAQGGVEQEQYIAPTEQGAGSLTFTGEGADNVSTETFQVDSNEWMIASQSDPTGNAPLISVETAGGDSIDAELEESGGIDDPFVYAVTADPGEYRLSILPLVDNASYTVTVDGIEGGGATEEQYQSPIESTEPADGNPPLMRSGGPEDGPVPAMPGGSCPPEYPVKDQDGCYGAR